ncbi:MAG: cupin domain-containing protein [Anaerolineales bacterium]|nr:cupin domain-containing protein [Anaerolineales bacterium]
MDETKKEIKPVSIANAEHYLWGDNSDGWPLLKRDDVSVIQEHVSAGKAEVMHYHKISRQFFYILEGEAEMRFENDLIALQKGEGLEIPPLVKHCFENNSSADVVFLVVSVPKSHGDRVNVE